MIEPITSLQNERVKRVVKLQRKASARREAGLTVIEGAREVSRALENGWQPTELWGSTTSFQRLEKFRGAGSACFQCSENVDATSPSRFSCSEHVDATSPSRFSCSENVDATSPSRFSCSEEVMAKISYRENPDGVLAVGPLVGKKLSDLELPENPLILVAEGVEKPGNLGALLRTADGAGVDAVIIADPATDLNNPNVIRNSIGTLFYLPIAEATSEETVDFLKKKGVRMLSAVPDADVVYTEADLSGPLAIVVGAEDQGLSNVWLARHSLDEGGEKQADLNVKVPMLGKNDSLNVSVSAAIILYEAVRQRK